MKFVKVLGILLFLFVVINGLLVVRFYNGKREVQQHNTKLGSVKLTLPEVTSLEIVPVVDSRAAAKDFMTEDGVSYYIQTSHERILFDVGWNKMAEQNSPLLFNMKKLGLAFSDLSAIVISHNHPDHVGGMGFRDKKVTTGADNVDTPVYTPVSMTCGSATTNTVSGPLLIGKDMASTGPLAEQMYVPGKVYEQALMVNVKGKGLVLISGCGHPQINNMVEKAQAITGLPVYAVVGGTHLYYTSVESAFWRRIMGSTKVFALGNTRQEVETIVKSLKQQGVRKVIISAHDADQASLDIFASRYGSDFDVVTVAKSIKF